MSNSGVVFFYEPDDLDKLAELKQRADIAIRAAESEQTSARIGDAAESPQAAIDELKAFARELADRTPSARVGHIGQEAWRLLLSQHRPRYERRMIDGQLQDVMHDDDQQFGVNTDTFPSALLNYVDPEDPDNRTILEPAFAAPVEREKWLKRRRGGDFLQLWTTAWALNGRVTQDPKALLASLETSLSWNGMSD